MTEQKRKEAEFRWREAAKAEREYSLGCEAELERLHKLAREVRECNCSHCRWLVEQVYPETLTIPNVGTISEGGKWADLQSETEAIDGDQVI